MAQMTNIMQAMWESFGMAKKAADEYSRSTKELTEALARPTLVINYTNGEENVNNNVE
jgi:hypothetical protein